LWRIVQILVTEALHRILHACNVVTLRGARCDT
jgi:hypothetical protein